MAELLYDDPIEYDTEALYSELSEDVVPELSRIWPDDLPLPMRDARHQFLPRNSRTTFETGRVRIRRIYIPILEPLHCVWNFTADQFDTFKTFFEENLVNGSLTFTIEILGETEEREARFLDATYNFSRSDNLDSVSASLLLSPIVAPFENGFDFWLDGVPVLTLRPGSNFAAWNGGTVFADQKK